MLLYKIRTNILNDAFELPYLEEMEEMERQRSQAVESLKIIDNSQVSRVWYSCTYSWEVDR